MTIRRGDILWADLGMFPTTSVQGGVRPVIVVSNNKANTYSSVITVVPLTSRIYKKRYYICSRHAATKACAAHRIPMGKLEETVLEENGIWWEHLIVEIWNMCRRGYQNKQIYDSLRSVQNRRP